MDTYNLRILHLSDLHEGRLPNWRRGLVLGAEWFNNLEIITDDCRGKNRSIDLVCFTGDAAYSGKLEEFTRAGEFLEGVLHYFGLGKDRLFIVPGNHDIDRSVAQEAWKTLRRDIPRARTSDVSSWFAYAGDSEKDIPPLGLNNTDRNQLMERQNAYREWLAQLGRKELLPSLASVHPRFGYCARANLPRFPFNVNIVGLDSAWLAGDENDAGKIWLTDEQVMLHASDVNGDPLPGFCLALVHHPLSDLADGADAWRLLAGRVDLLLRGHLHEPALSVWADPDRKLQQLTAGCLYEHHTYPNAFQIIDIELDEQGRPRVYEVWFRGWSKSGHWYDENRLYRDCKGGRLSLWPTAPVTKSLDAPDFVEKQQRIDLSRMPVPLAENVKLIGRAGDIRNLKTAFSNFGISIVAIIGHGGTGKSFLIREFLKELDDNEYDGTDNVFAWSFYDQGQHQMESSSIAFFREALKFFGHGEDIPSAEQGRAKLLSNVFRQQKNLLVLDGVEILQYPPNDNKGRFRDQAVGDFLRDIARHGLSKGGLILLTSRQKIVELEEWKQGLYREIQVAPLARNEGLELLREIGVHGSDEEICAASEEMGGHPLALVLLGNMLRMKFNRDVNMRHMLPNLIEHVSPRLTKDKMGVRQARRMMLYYDGLWCKEDAAERTFLRLLGLFGRPMMGEQLRELLTKSKFARNSRLIKLSDDEWSEMERTLRGTGLAVRTQTEPASLGSNYPFGKWDDTTQWDAHPIIREYFSERLHEENFNGWQEAHEILFNFFAQKACDEEPNSAQGLEPLYRAVYHGCLAGKYQEAYHIYRYRIARDDKGYDTELLGLTMSALVALCCFFPNGVSNSPTTKIGEYDQAWLLARASYCFDSAGRLDTAEGLRERSNAIFVRLNRFDEAAQGCEELADIQTRLGKLDDALETARLSVKASDTAAEQNVKTVTDMKDGSEWRQRELEMRKVRRYATRATAATILHRQGKLLDALACFQEAEELYREIEREIPLHSVPGIRYCTLLLDMSEDKDTLKILLNRADVMLKFIGFPLMIDLHRLSRGRILFELSELLSDEDLCNEALNEVNIAVDGIRGKHKIQLDCQPLLARAVIWNHLEEFGKARTDIDEVIRISSECRMALYETDANIALGHMILDQTKLEESDDQKKKNRSNARTAFHTANSLIIRHNYNLRLSDLHLLDARIEHAQGREKEARGALQKAEYCAETIGLKRMRKYIYKVAREMRLDS